MWRDKNAQLKTFILCFHSSFIHFAKMTKLCEACDDFCNVERYHKVFWTYQYSTSAFKKHLNFKQWNVFLRNKTNITCLLSSCLWVAKMKFWIKNNFYKYKFTTDEELEYLRQPEIQNSEHAFPVYSEKTNLGTYLMFWLNRSLPNVGLEDSSSDSKN